MFNKFFFIAFSLILLATYILADYQQKYELDSGGKPVQFWLKGNDLKYYDARSSSTKTLFSFTREVESFALHRDNTNYFIVYSLRNENHSGPLFFIYSNNEGYNFSSPLLLTTVGAAPALAFSNNNLALAWEESNGITIINSMNGGGNFSNPTYLAITGEALSSPTLSFDPNNNLHLSFISQNQSSFLYRIFYSQIEKEFLNSLLPSEPKEIFNSPDEVTNLILKYLSQPLILWQVKYNDRFDAYLSSSLDNGKSFWPGKPFLCKQKLEDLILNNGKYYLIIYDKALSSKEIKFPISYSPSLAAPIAGQAYNSAKFTVKYFFPSYQMDWGTAPQLLSKIDISGDNAFPSYNTVSFEEVISATPEAIEYHPDLSLEDGTYYVRVSVSDGLSRSGYGSALPFIIDNRLPELITLEAEKELDKITFKGRTNKKPVDLTINGSPILFQADDQFQSQFSLSTGQNIFIFFLSDNAGNQNLITREVYYNPQAPVIQLISPASAEWFKPNSTGFFEMKVADPQNDIEDGTQAQLFINSEATSDPLIYNLEENKITGFITLPPFLLNGKYPARVEISDRLGNKGEIGFNINIDGSPPMVIPLPTNQLYCNSANALSLPLFDTEAGIDANGTLVKIGSVSLEGTVSAESDHLDLFFKSPLPEGSYEVEVLPRDRVGNLGSAHIFSLIIDNTAPRLTLEGSLEPTTQLNLLTIHGKVEDQNPCRLNIYNNNHKVASFDINNLSFSKEVKLSPGTNYFLIEALDQAGNKTSQNFMIKAQISGAAAVLKDCKNGPNPFSPRNQTMYFTYTLNSPLIDPVNLKISVYDLAGKMLWQKEIPNAPASNIIAWEGTDHFGKKLGNGVYPYFISVSAGDQHEMRRGKIVVLN